MRREEFKEHISAFLKRRIEEVESELGHEEALKLRKQYEYDIREEVILEGYSDRHYHADSEIQNVERLYDNHACIEINFHCAAHCRYCLRSNYERRVITEAEMDEAINYIRYEKLSELLITGGDPLMTPKVLSQFLMKLNNADTDIKVVRIATRLITQAPEKITSEVLDILKYYNNYWLIEVATQINTYLELQSPEVLDAVNKIRAAGVTIYSQNVFLKGVNDTPEDLINLYFEMRYAGIEPHYLFHAVPLVGTDHMRTSVMDMVRCYNAAFNSGKISGRAKPKLALMTDIGKVILNNLNTLEYNGDSIIIKSDYKYSDRLAINPSWELPGNAWVDSSDNIWIEYLGSNSSKS